jgi:hypothetical protein
MRYSIGTLLVLILAPAIALGDVQYKTAIVAAPTSPAKLTTCEAWARDWNFTVAYVHESKPNMLFDFGVSVENNATQPITAVRVTMTSYDAFNAVLASTAVDSATNDTARAMSLAPGATLDLLGPRGWHGGNRFPNRDHVSCELSAVRFADGTSWIAPAASPSP